MTRRKVIMEILQNEEHSAESLARLFYARPQSILRDLVHIEKSLKAEGRRLLIQMPYCRDCGFVFHVQKPCAPSKCPKCRSEWIEKPRFKVID